MPGDQREGGGGLPEPLLDVLADPERGRHRLPYLLGLLDGGDQRSRLAASLTVCLVVDEYPEMLDYVVRRLADRLGDGAPVEVGHALDYLAARNPREVDEAVTDLDGEAELRARESLFQSGAGFARTDSLAPSPGDRAVGRTRLAGGSATPDDPRQVYENRSVEDERDPLDDDANGDDGDGQDSDGTDGDDSDATGGGGDGGSDGGEGSSDGRGDDRPSVTRGTLTLVSRRLSDVIGRSRFDDLNVLTERRRGRYGDVYRAVGTLDGEEYGLALCVFELPPDDRRRFARAFAAAMERWSAVADHEAVLTVHDWGVRPRPWAALEHVDRTLDDREGSPVDAALSDAVDLASGVAYAHRHGVVHGAVDPENVALRGTALTRDADRRPLLANVGVASAYAGHEGAANYLDPRYAAPEHYAGEFGGVDHATDVYGLGLVIYRLCVGEHPYDGSVDRVRERVLDGETPVPSAADPDVPAALDQIVGKATAARKLKRYETVNHLQRELRSVETDGA